MGFSLPIFPLTKCLLTGLNPFRLSPGARPLRLKP
jgi:hypothetical protein